MQLRTLTRLSAIGAVGLALAGGALQLVAPAGALEQERVTLTDAGEVIVDYDPIIGNNPGPTVDSSTTVDSTVCSGVGCDVIPLTITEPPGTEDGEYYVTITLEWSSAEVPNAPLLGDYAVNDMDMYVQNDPIVDGAGPDEDGFAYKGATSGNPEQTTMYAPIGDYNVFVVNYTGVNTGYRLKFKVITDDLPDTIFESLPPVFSGGAPAPTPRTAIPTPTFDATPPPTVNIAPATPPVADSSFARGFDEGSTLEDQLAGAEAVAIAPASTSRPSAPSNLALLFWLAALPLALVAIAGAVIMRKQRALLPGLG